jgi:hypothetical protein
MILGPTEEPASATLVDGDLKLQFVKFAAHPVHKAPTYYFRMIHSQMDEELGGINLRVGSAPHLHLYAGHIGYTIHPPIGVIGMPHEACAC